MDLGPCPSCGLTPLGDGLLRHELDQLQRTRPRGAWTAQVCDRCEGVSAIADPTEGWTLGSPSPGPVRLVSGADPVGNDPLLALDPPVVAAAASAEEPTETDGPSRPVSAERFAVSLPDPLVVIERIVAEVTGAAGDPGIDVELPDRRADDGRPTARTMLPESWAFAAK